EARLLGITLVTWLVFKSMVIVCFPRDNETPLKDKPSATVSISKFIHGIISLDDVKVVKNAMNIYIILLFCKIMTSFVVKGTDNTYTKLCKKGLSSM
ncbi:unnamed protein product, partial [Brassica oleracea]